jgi:hypothetical protein
LVEKWEWVIGGVVDNNPQYVRAIIHDFVGIPIPEYTSHSEDGMRADRRQRIEDARAERQVDALEDDGREYPKGYDGTGTW